MSTDLHHGFADIERSTQPQTLFDFLEMVNSLPEIRAYKRVMRTYLRLRDGDTVLDVGCGIGIEARRIANECPGVRVIGLDRESMIAEAQDRAGAEGASIRWLSGQAENIPLPDDSVDACMTERVLMYLPDPALGIAEMVRVLKPGGRVSCFELDYDAAMLGGDPVMAATVNDLMNGTLGEPRMGRRLPTYLRDAGLTGISLHPVIFFPPLPVYEATVATTVREAIARGDLPHEQATQWLQSQADAANAGLFFSAFVGIVTSASLPL